MANGSLASVPSFQIAAVPLQYLTREALAWGDFWDVTQFAGHIPRKRLILYIPMHCVIDPVRSPKPQQLVHSTAKKPAGGHNVFSYGRPVSNRAELLCD